MSLTIHGLGTALPPHCLAQGDAATVAARVALPEHVSSPSKRRLLETLHRRTGVAMRHIVLEDLTGKNAGQDQSFFGSTSPGTGERMRRYAQEAPPLALKAVRAALEQAQLAPERITHLVTVSCTGFHAPGVDLGACCA